LNWLGKSYLDGVEIGATEFYTQLAASTELATTSAVPMGQFIEAFKPYLDEGREVFYLGFTSGLSATVEFAFQAQKAMGNPENLRIMETKIISMALTLWCLKSAKKLSRAPALTNSKLSPKTCIHESVFISPLMTLSISTGVAVSTPPSVFWVLCSI